LLRWNENGRSSCEVGMRKEKAVVRMEEAVVVVRIE